MFDPLRRYGRPGALGGRQALPGGGGGPVSPKVRGMRVREEAREIGGERRRGETSRSGVAHVEARVLNGVRQVVLDPPHEAGR